MQTVIEDTAAANAEYTKTVISKAADIIEDMAAGQHTWSAETALKQADHEFRSQNGKVEIQFSLTAVINSLNRHFKDKHQRENPAVSNPWSPTATLAPGHTAETAANSLRKAAPQVAKEVHNWTVRTGEALDQIARLPITEEEVREAVREAKGK